MFDQLIEPDTPEDESVASAAADAAANAAAEAAGSDEGKDEPSLEERALAAFDEGAEGADEAPAPAPKTNEEGGDDDGEVEGDDGEGAPAGDDGEETPEAKAAREKSEREAAARAEDDKIVKELNLRGKTEARFREMSGRIRDLNERLEQAGGEDVLKKVVELGGKDGLERVVRDATDQRQWDEKLVSIGCTPEQFGNAIGAIAAFNSNDPTALKQARDYLLRSVGEIDEKLGVKSEHYDPLQEHADLQAKVRKGEMDESDALEIARLRGVAKKGQQTQEQVTQQQRAAQAQQQGLDDLRALGSNLSKRDGPELFKAKMASIQALINSALPDLPPEKWVEYAQRLYDSAPAPQPAQARPRVGKQPVRTSHATSGAPNGGAIHPNTPKNPWDAFDSGVTEAREAGL